MQLISLSFYDYLSMLVYLGILIGIGVKHSRKEKTSEDYLLGGRSMPWMAVGISMFMSLFSTYSLVMVPGEIFSHGLSMWVLYLLSPIFSILSFLIFVRFYFKIKAFTPFEYLEYRYDRKVRLLVSALYLYSRILYLAMVLFATAKVFEGGAGWPSWMTIIVAGSFAIVYTAMGGIKGIVWADVFQFFILLIGFGLVLYALQTNIEGGLFSSISYAFTHGRGLDRFAEADFYKLSPYVRLSFWLLLLSTVLGPISGAASDQVTIQRLLSTSSYKSAFKAQITSSFIGIPVTLVIWFMGLAIFTYYAQHPGIKVADSETAFFSFISNKLPTPAPGFFMAAMLAAAMSTLDSGINSLSSVWLKEFHLKFINKDIPELRQVRISRIASVLVGIFAIVAALILAYSSEVLRQSLVEVTTIFTVFDVIVFPAFVFAVFSRRANSVFLWRLAMYMWGLKTGMIVWYIVTKRATVLWKEGMELGLAGAISSMWMIIPLAVSAAVLALWFVLRKKEGRIPSRILTSSTLPLGFASAMVIWFIFSNTVVSDTPKESSFQWVGFPVLLSFAIFGTIGVRMSKVQPLEKYQGLTWDTSGRR